MDGYMRMLFKYCMGAYLLMVILLACTYVPNKKESGKEISMKKNTWPENVVVLQDTIHAHSVDNNLRHVAIDSSSILAIDSIFFAYLSIRDGSNFPDNGTVFSPKTENVAYLHEEFYNYKRQYFAYLNGDNDTLIYLNAVCDVHEYDWRKKLIVVMDGGRCYFQMTYNKSKKKITRFMINGEA